MNDIGAVLKQAVSCFNSGDLAEAEALANKVLGPEFKHMDVCRANASHLLGLIASQRGQGGLAIRMVERAVQIDPRNTEARFNLGHILRRMNRMQEALVAFDEVVSQNPKNGEAHLNRANILWGLGHREEAVSACESALQITPGNAVSHYNYGNMLRETGQEEEALAAYEKATKLNPQYVEAVYNRAALCRDLGRLEEALAGFEQAIRISPEMARAYIDHGNALWDLGHLNKALEDYEHAIHLDPENATAYYNRGNILRDLGRNGSAESSYRQALHLRPDYLKVHSNLLSMLAAAETLSPDKMLEEQCEWDRVHGQEGRRRPFPARTPKVASGRRLRIGYVSPDLRNHAVSHFFEPLLAAHDRKRFEIFCYASLDKAHSDKTTERLCRISEHWCFVADIEDKELASLIYEDHIDILIDLAGHTAGNRLRAFTYRPAPVQATYLGFFAATGLQAIDYWITDEVLHPHDTPEQTVETIYRLPRCSHCYLPPAKAPSVAPCPNLGERVVFGSFSNLLKLTPEVVEVWSRILHEHPGSQLLLTNNSMGNSEVREQLFRRFLHHGIPAERLIVRYAPKFEEWFKLYAEVDVVLDPFPRTGTTTTSEALWMGLPVITLAGQRYVSRASATVLTAVGLEDLITHSQEEYIGKALSVARDPSRRVKLRKHLREKMAHSPLCDSDGLAISMEAAYMSMWERFIQQEMK